MDKKLLCLGAMAFITTVLHATTWVNINNDQNIGSFFGIASTQTTTVTVGIDGLIATRDIASGAWTIIKNNGDPDYREVVYIEDKFITVGEGGMLESSADGYNWTVHDSGTSNDLRVILWDGSHYFIAGEGGTLLRGANLDSLESIDTGSTIFFNAMAYSGSTYLLVGGFGMVISDDGINWNQPPSFSAPFSLESATWTGSEFLIGGLGEDIFASNSGISWSPRYDAAPGFCESMITVDGITYICGGNGFILEAVGEVFTNTYNNPTGSEYFMDLTWSGSEVLVAGFNHNVYTSGTITPPSEPYITSARILPEVILGQSYSHQLTAVGGQAPFSWGLVSGLLPQGFALSSDGIILGSTSVAGSYSFTVEVFDQDGDRSEKSLQIHVRDPNLSPIILSATYGANGVFADVTTIVEDAIESGNATIQASNSTMGGDPIFGVVKDLTVTYMFGRVVYEESAREGSSLTLPDEGHTQKILSWSQWSELFFSEQDLLDNTISGPDKDPDGDGLNNLAEFAFGGLPFSHDIGDVGLSLQKVSDKMVPGFWYDSSRSVSVKVEVSNTLAPNSWTEIAQSNGGAMQPVANRSTVSDPAIGRRFVSVEESNPTNNAPSFYRVRVESQ
jgi:hypothetical protein